ncbi:MAG: HRDC domain-containing protein [Pseudomonadota bacterium]
MTIPYEFIDSTDALQRLASRLTPQPIIAVDLEADSMHHFHEKVCLLQLAADGINAVVDPLAVTDLSPLAALFADPGIRKVFHGADYDVRSLYRDFGFEINNLFDTQLASVFTGQSETGLDAVVSRYFDVHLDKRYQKKDWAQRPLPEEMVAYAAADAIYLIHLAEKLTGELTALGRLEWVLEECRLLSRVRADTGEPAPLFLKCKGAGTLDRRGLAVLEKLLVYRASMAEKKDRPPFKVMSAQSLLTIAAAKPSDLNDLAALKALSDRQMASLGQGVLAQVGAAMKLPGAALPIYPRKRAPRLPRMAPERIQRLKTWRDGEAGRLGLDPSVVCTKAQITEVAIANPQDVDALGRCTLLKRWQIDAFGAAMVSAIARKPGGKR